MRLRGWSTVGIVAVAALAMAASAPAATLSGDFDGDGFDDLAIGVQNEDVEGFSGGGAVQVVYGSRDGLSARDRIITRATRGVNGSPGNDGFGSSLAAGDFDGDGFDDLAVGAPFDATSEFQNQGSVQILFGSRGGLNGRGDQLLMHGRGGLRPPQDDFEGFGWTLAADNLAGDRRDDLVVTTFLGRAGGVMRAGYVEILRGTARGVSTRGAKRISAATKGIRGEPQDFARFGTAITIGDVGRSDRNDLAIGVPFQTVGGVAQAGCVHVLYGSRRGVRARGNQYLDQEVLYGGDIGVDGTPEADDFLGFSLTMANWDARAKEDLVIGAPGEDVTDESPSPTANSGLISFAYGGPRGVRTAPQPVGGLMEPIASDTWTANAGFGSALEAADVAQSPREEVFVGSPHSDVEGGAANAGAVGVIYGEGTGYDSIQQGVDEIAGGASNSDLFGLALSAGDFNGRGRADLAIGAPNDAVLPPEARRRGARRGGPVPVRAGSVQIVPGGPSGIVRSQDRILYQGSAGLEGTPGLSDFFGVALSTPDSGPTSD